MWLKHSMHMHLHDKDKKLDLMLKRECQKAFERKYDRKTFMRVFGKNYLKEEEE